MANAKTANYAQEFIHECLLTTVCHVVGQGICVISGTVVEAKSTSGTSLNDSIGPIDAGRLLALAVLGGVAVELLSEQTPKVMTIAEASLVDDIRDG